MMNKRLPKTTGSHRDKAFTIIELIVVISIIALLIAILLPALQQARSIARIAACKSNQRQIGIAIHVYANDFNGYAPYNSAATATSPQMFYFNPVTLAARLVNSYEYLPQTRPAWGYTDVMQCPGDPNPWYAASLGGSYAKSYRYRQAYNGIANGEPDDEPLRLDSKPDFYQKTATWFLVESFTQTTFNGQTLIIPTTFANATLNAALYSGYGTVDRNTVNSQWHEDGTNVLYEDGHVGWAPWGEPQFGH
ncbi:type II secretion system protein [Phycisphaerales bacterium AB-hyl4]|uniref:Type II secretion system protein n=1 Tax=Natronomicrosphaera hydrolytica TaxID=3242702 RepID=A0ABV4U7A2_9BACT